MKYGIGMFLLALGMAVVAFGANGIEPGAKNSFCKYDLFDTSVLISYTW